MFPLIPVHDLQHCINVAGPHGCQRPPTESRLVFTPSADVCGWDTDERDVRRQDDDLSLMAGRKRCPSASPLFCIGVLVFCGGASVSEVVRLQRPKTPPCSFAFWSCGEVLCSCSD